MKKYYLFVFCLFFIFACSEQQESIVTDNDSVVADKISSQEAQKKFAKVLSRAISDNSALRSFIKEESLKQFDNDYDVFYPFVKHKIVSGKQTFREILLSYCENEGDLKQIEESSLLLNILVPDLSLFGGFNAEKWDITNNDVAVVANDDADNTVYEDGEEIGSLSLSEIPAFPCLVVKNNERMFVSNAATRADGAIYKFTDDAFNGELNRQTRHSSFDQAVEETDNTEFYIPASKLHPSIIKAWEEFKNISNAYARDYIYYNIDKANQSGELNRNIRESIYKFRIFPSWIKIVDQEGSDPSLVTEFTQKKRYLTNDEIIAKMWKDGNLEIVFDTYLGAETSKEVMRHRNLFSLKATQLWSLEKVHIYHKNSTGFRHSKNTYTVNTNNLKPKWVYPGELGSDNSVFFQPWDLYSSSTLINLFISETDDGQTIEETRTVMNQYVNKFDANVEASGGKDKGMKWGVKMGYGYTETTSNTGTTKIVTTKESDDLGNIIINFSDPIIVSDSEKNTKGYKVYAVKAGNAVEVIMLPKYLY